MKGTILYPFWDRETLHMLEALSKNGQERWRECAFSGDPSHSTRLSPCTKPILNSQMDHTTLQLSSFRGFLQKIRAMHDYLIFLVTSWHAQVINSTSFVSKDWWRHDCRGHYGTHKGTTTTRGMQCSVTLRVAASIECKGCRAPEECRQDTKNTQSNARKHDYRSQHERNEFNRWTLVVSCRWGTSVGGSWLVMARFPFDSDSFHWRVCELSEGAKNLDLKFFDFWRAIAMTVIAPASAQPTKKKQPQRCLFLLPLPGLNTYTLFQR